MREAAHARTASERACPVNPGRVAVAHVFAGRGLSPSQYSAATFLDVHVYPTSPTFSLADDLASSEWSSVDFSRVPVFMGEFGAFKFLYSNVVEAAEGMRDLQVCERTHPRTAAAETHSSALRGLRCACGCLGA
jgi:hypothetical protein